MNHNQAATPPPQPPASDDEIVNTERAPGPLRLIPGYAPRRPTWRPVTAGAFLAGAFMLIVGMNALLAIKAMTAPVHGAQSGPLARP